MRSSTILAVAASLYTPSAAVLQGFNYGATLSDGTVKDQAMFEAEFKAAQNLVGNSGFTSARLYTTVQSGGGPISAIPAAIATKTSLLLGMWVSGGEANVMSEIDALKSAISTYGTAFTDLVVGLSIGSEDLYRSSEDGIKAKAGVGVGPDTVVSYINQVKSAIAGTSLSSVPIGHVDTWTAWANSSNSAVVDACDWIGMDAYPFFQSTQANGIDNGKSLFVSAFDTTSSLAKGKPVWITETGWPVSGTAQGQADASIANAKKYYDAVGCGYAFGNVNTWWYMLQDTNPVTPNPSFGLVGSTLSTTPLYDLSCANKTSSSSISSSATSTTSISGTSASGAAKSSASTTLASVAAGSTGTGSGSGSPNNGTYTAATSISSASASATQSSSSSGSTNTVGSTGGASSLSASAFGLLGAFVAMMIAL